MDDWNRTTANGSEIFVLGTLMLMAAEPSSTTNRCCSVDLSDHSRIRVIEENIREDGSVVSIPISISSK